MATAFYSIRETDIGPVISESRVTVFDVLQELQAGENKYDICATLGLTPSQVAVALEYITLHRQTLESELREIQVKKSERLARARAEAALRQAQIDRLPATDERVAFYALREHNRLERASQNTQENTRDDDSE